ncbi:type II secretion system F family protein [Tessaracoccus sp.]
MTALVFLAFAAALAVGHPAERDLRRLRPPARRRRSGVMAPLVLACVVVVLVFLLVGPRMAGWLAAGGVVAATAGWLVRGVKEERQQARDRGETARAARTLALLLQAGQIPTRALEDAASDCPMLERAALTARLGGDVASTLEDMGHDAGRSGLAKVSAAWRVSELTGAPIAVVLARVAETLRQERHLASVVAAELAAARASGRIMAVLPFVAMGVGMLVGADPMPFLFGSWPGEVVLFIGVALAATGVVWTERIARTGETTRRGRP